MNVLLRPLAVGLGLAVWNHREEVVKAVTVGLKRLELQLEDGVILKVNGVEIRQGFKANNTARRPGMSSPSMW